MQASTDRPRLALLRPPAKADGILRTRVPFTVTTRARGSSKDCSFSPPPPASVPRSRRPHVTPMAGDNVLLRALQALLSELPGKSFGEQDTFSTLLMKTLSSPRLGLTTQASQPGSVCAACRES